MPPRLSLPKTATAPFCMTETADTVVLPPGASFLRRVVTFAGPGLLVAVGYMDPGNWATDIESGARFGYALLFVVAASSLAAILLQTLALRLGIATGLDLAQACRERYPPAVRLMLFLFAEIAIVATDIAEVLGAALAFKLLFGFPLPVGILLTGFDTLLVLGLKGRGFRQVEAIIGGLVATIALCFVVELVFVGPDFGAVAAGLVPSLSALRQPGALYLAIGILGATVMPHNIYLHSAVVKSRRIGGTDADRAGAIRMATGDTIVSLLLAACVNAAILILAAAAFHGTPAQGVADIEDAYRLLEPVTGIAAAALLFAIALFASGQSSTFTGTIAGQVVLEGFLDLRIPCWQQRVITRILAICPALVGVWWLGDGSIGRLLVLTQVVLSAQLPFAIYPLIRFTSDAGMMGRFATPRAVAALAWVIFLAIAAANIWLVVRTVAG